MTGCRELRGMGTATYTRQGLPRSHCLHLAPGWDLRGMTQRVGDAGSQHTGQEEERLRGPVAAQGG